MDLTLTPERAGGSHIYKGPGEPEGWGGRSLWSGEGLKGTKAAVQSGVQGSLRSPGLTAPGPVTGGCENRAESQPPGSANCVQTLRQMT